MAILFLFPKGFSFSCKEKEKGLKIPNGQGFKSPQARYQVDSLQLLESC
jgi:hypothetical protein